MEKESRIIIDGLSEEAAITLLPAVRKLAKGTGAKLELQNPGPPDICEKEYRVVDGLFMELHELTDHDFGGSEKPAEVRRDVRALRKILEGLTGTTDDLRLAVNDLEKAIPVSPSKAS